MANSFIAIDEPAVTDKKLDTEQLTVGANTVERERVQIAGATDTAIAGVDATNGLDVDVTRIAAGDNNIGNVDIVTVPAPLSTTGGGTEATALRVTLASDSTGVLSVDDNGGSLTVDGTVAVTGVATLAEQQTQTTHLSNTATSLGVLDDWDNAASDGASVSGDTAHDAADAGEPVKIGAKAKGSLEAVTLVAENDRTDLFADLDGALLSRPQIPLGDLVSEAASNTDGASTALTNFGAVASIRNYVTAVNVFRTDAGSTPAYVDFRDGAAGAVLYRMPLPPNGGSVMTSAVPLFRTTANTALAFDVSSALTTVYINVSGFQSKV